jgi:hypothetical protein
VTIRGTGSNASQPEVITTPAPNKDVGAYIAAMADGECFGSDPEHECHEVFDVEHWCKTCLAVEVIAWHHAETLRLLRAAALDATASGEGWARRKKLNSRAFHYFRAGRSLCRRTWNDPMGLIDKPFGIVCPECRGIVEGART